ncbi:hypothetical protein BJ741DRAFT_592636 [Chytriomyces cf. hyalinus JEL632]|nr:hypothetical protein BJ741DRAFT_592636 [Chytriomyces cf. hyalinus JEL632]
MPTTTRTPTRAKTLCAGLLSMTLPNPAFNPALSKTEVSPISAVERAAGYNTAMNHIRIKSGIDSPVPVNDKGEVIDTDGLISIAREVARLEVDSTDFSTSASNLGNEAAVYIPPPLPTIAWPNSPPGTPPILPRTSSKIISMLPQQEKESTFVPSPLVSARPAARSDSG